MRIPKLRRNGDGRAFACAPRSGGKRVYFGKFGATDAERKYRQWCSRLLANANAPVDVDGKHDRLVIELSELYLNYAEGYYSKETYYNVEYAIQPLLNLYADELGRNIGPRWLINIQNWMIDRGYRRRVINDIIGRIRHMVSWCCTNEYLPADRYAALLSVKNLRKGRTEALESVPVQPVPYEHVLAIKPYVPPQIWAMIELQRLCGMRPQDICRMRPCDIDQTGEIWLYRVPDHKTAHLGKVLVKAMPVTAQAILRPYLDRDPSAYCFSPKETVAWRREHTPAYQDQERKTPLYPSETKRKAALKAKRARRKVRSRGHRDHYDTGSYRQAICYGFDRAEKAKVVIPHWHPNQLRHAIATEISQTIGQQAAQRWLGHAHLSTTSVYAQIQERELIAIAKSLDEQWQDKPGAA